MQWKWGSVKKKRRKKKTLCKRGAKCVSEKYGAISACAVQAGKHDAFPFVNLKFSACQKLILPQDSVR